MANSEDQFEAVRPIQRGSIARMIRKYSNRRLYDTVESRYICLEDIRKLVSARIAFAVVDADNGSDITRSVLVDALVEQEECAEPALSRDFLSNMICTHHEGERSALSSYLEQSLKLFLTQQ